jgi:hypothetical protein
MTATARRWYPLLLLRDTRGRFARLRATMLPIPAVVRVPLRRSSAALAVQMVLF